MTNIVRRREYFNRDYPELGDNGYSVKFVVFSEDYDDADALMVSCWEDKEGGVSHLKNDTLAS